jgi:hypothetical protein
MKIRINAAIICASIIIGLAFSALGAQAGLFSKKSETPTPAASADSSTSSYRSEKFLRLNTDKDNEISLKEFLKDQTDDFTRRDADKSGALSADELDFPPGTPPEQLAEMRKRLKERDEQSKKMREEMDKRRLEMDKKVQEENAKREEEQKKKQAEKSATETETPAAEIKTEIKTETKKP